MYNNVTSWRVRANHNFSDNATMHFVFFPQIISQTARFSTKQLKIKRVFFYFLYNFIQNLFHSKNSERDYHRRTRVFI
jgi:hypothetical protein